MGGNTIEVRLASVVEGQLQLLSMPNLLRRPCAEKQALGFERGCGSIEVLATSSPIVDFLRYQSAAHIRVLGIPVIAIDPSISDYLTVGVIDCFVISDSTKHFVAEVSKFIIDGSLGFFSGQWLHG